MFSVIRLSYLDVIKWVNFWIISCLFNYVYNFVLYSSGIIIN
jgi:hypothetical protein